MQRLLLCLSLLAASFLFTPSSFASQTSDDEIDNWDLIGDYDFWYEWWDLSSEQGLEDYWANTFVYRLPDEMSEWNFIRSMGFPLEGWDYPIGGRPGDPFPPEPNPQGAPDTDWPDFSEHV
jgi:hypothetical protein